MRLLRLISATTFLLFLVLLLASFFVELSITAGPFSLVTGTTGFALWAKPSWGAFSVHFKAPDLIPSWAYFFDYPRVGKLADSWFINICWSFVLNVSLVLFCVAYRRILTRPKSGFPVEPSKEM
jgi:hypothetical protein